MAPSPILDDRQRAVLQLLLTQGKSYDDLAGLLHLDIDAVRARARGAVDALAPETLAVGDDRRAEIADYLLGQQDAASAAATRQYLAGSAAGRAWARIAATALSPLAKSGLPDIPPEPAPPPPPPPAPAPAPAAPEVPEQPAAAAEPPAAAAAPQRSSQLGGRLIAAGVGLVVAIGIIVAFGLTGGDDDTTATTTTTTPSTTTTPQTTATAPTGEETLVLAQGQLRPAQNNGSTGSGLVVIVRYVDSGDYRLALQVKDLPPSSTRGSTYGVWLYNSPQQAQFIGFPDTVVGQDGKLEAVANLSPDTPNYREVLITRETGTAAPRRPGTIILRGRLVTAVEQARAQQRQGQTQTQTTP